MFLRCPKCGFSFGLFTDETDRNYLIDENRKLVNSLMNFRVPTWISVEERLPDLGQKVFTLGPRGALDCGKFIGLVGTRRTDWKDCRWQRFGARKIRFWMPTDFLPAPPTKGVE